MIVLGLGYGDEGKGHVTNYLANKTPKSIVVRFNGGHQAGHTVNRHGHRHVFSSFGSGTLNMRPTYWTKKCVFYPIAFSNELNAIIDYYKNNHAKSLDFMPKFYIDALCPVATPFDRLVNQNDAVNMAHGTCGVGFGATLKRHFDNHLKLHVQDLFNESVLKMKLENIKAHYCNWDAVSQMYRKDPGFDIHVIANQFVYIVKEILPFLNIVKDDGAQLFGQFVPVFEGAQGILLDQDFGFFPNVTRSNTTSKNALEIASSIPARYGAHGKLAQIYYVTRCYQTRHGNGPMTYENDLHFPVLKNNENETNVKNDYQGKFRYGVLDVDMINYAIDCDSHFSKDNVKNLVITCYDQVEKKFPVYKNNKLHIVDPFELSKLIDHRFNNVLVSDGDLEENIESLWKK